MSIRSVNGNRCEYWRIAWANSVVNVPLRVWSLELVNVKQIKAFDISVSTCLLRESTTDSISIVVCSL